MEFDLEDGRGDASVAEEIEYEGTLEVGDTNRLGETEVNEVLHRLPGLLDGCFALNDFALEVGPAGGVGVLGIDVLESHGEVDVEEVELAG